ncbi:phage integrase Arm DNA-binding domain-containing protein [Plesiomonas shigelloides]|uniref:phage integrase Arm DNA-binding domain-containing protein n=1 Tax=Plesiomonas shigelloides TaxID=703 RepID=UPI001262156F|nr:phage integrase Arm DNA-binding domain-containing protein [Plesiomonas shigelloides]KAB7695000.1 tyrosine-type recombinase/integrase [Plesiomonas shigelloides]
MARPRKNKIAIPNLYCRLNRKTNTIYWQYKNPRDGKFYGLGTDYEEAAAIATEANNRLSSLRAKQLEAELLKRNKTVTLYGISVELFLDKFEKYQQERFENGQIRENTFKQKAYPISFIRQHIGSQPLNSVNVGHCNEMLNELVQEDKRRMAQIIRGVLIEMFKVAQHFGDVQPGYNPAEATLLPFNRVTRSRLTFDEFMAILDIAKAKKRQPWLRHAMLLGLVTGQRLGDLLNMKYSDIKDGYLHVVQQKTGMKIAISTNLYNEALKLSLQDVIDMTRDNRGSEYIIHTYYSTSQTKAGSAIKNATTLSTAFGKLRDQYGIDWGEQTPASFHEIRSLSERLYREQGINTQKLLGHASQKMTDKYNNNRGKEFLKLDYD